ncbi:HEAT repeat [Singulisphaera sp. GP187]|uniref:HEAT repeat domain-containing protein n=1 Tax=Singulisphaera sp. GP187 TaxID=1882752 RepID=UPI000925E7F8|nr:HEAT repeat domain-containing protein [Singulisphaera sp. GP187]SIO44755.1 HEAT repeat [Singulisphaera sp. GP187]
MNPIGERLSERSASEPQRTRHHLTGLRAMIALVACTGLILWAARVVWENRDPALTEERAIQDHALRVLLSPNATERMGAIQDLERLRHADGAIAIRHLTAMLGDADSTIRIASVDALGTIGARAIRTGSDDAAIPAAIRALTGLLKDPQPAMRMAAANTLGAMTEANHRPGPPRSGGRNKAPTPASAVITPVETKSVIAALTETLGDPNAEVRGKAINALAAATSLADPPKAFAATLKDESAENRRTTVVALAQYRRGLDSWIPALLRIAEHDENPAVRTMGVGVLTVRIGPPKVTAASVPALIARLESRDPEVRRAVAEVLGRFGPDADPAIPILLRIFTEATDGEVAGSPYESQVQGDAAQALGKIAPLTASAKEVITTLTEVVRSGTSDKQRQATWALSEFGPKAAPAIPVLIRMAREAGPLHAFANEGAAAWALRDCPIRGTNEH